MYGKRGTIETHYGGEVTIRGSAPYKGGKTSGIYAGGAVNNIATFYEDITKGRYANVTVEPSVHSTLTVFLGRTAAYKHTEVTWDDMMRANEKLEYDLKGLKS